MSHADEVEQLLNAALERVRGDDVAKGERVLFPNGVERLHVLVQVGPDNAPLIKVELDASGPNPRPLQPPSHAVAPDIKISQLKDGLWMLLDESGGPIGEVFVESSSEMIEFNGTEHWFIKPDHLSTGKTTKMVFAGEDTLDKVKNRARVLSWHYFKCPVKGPMIDY